MSEIKRQRERGRPTNESLRARGLLKISDKCKICQSPYRDEISKLLLEGTSGEEIRRQFNALEYFKDIPINPTNIMSHKSHCDPAKVAEQDHITAIEKQVTKKVDPVINQLYQQRYDEKINKLKTVDEIYRQRLLNLGALQLELDEIKNKSEEERTVIDKARIHELTLAIDETLSSLQGTMLKHMKVEQGPAQKNVNLIFINNMKSGVEQFIEAFMDVLVSEIGDNNLRERIKDKFTDKLDSIMLPLLDSKAIDTDFEVIEQKKLPENTNVVS